MTEVPEYLLRRSKERREALGLAPVSGSSGGGDAPGDAPDEGSGGTATATAAPETAPAVPEAAAAAAPEAAAVAVAAPTEDLPTYLPPAGPKNGIPVWMYPVLVLLPLWAVVYLGSFGSRGGAVSPAELGAQVYSSACASCHGATGGGGIGPPLAGGEAALTFPNEEDHLAWVQNGSAPKKGQGYGDPARPGGQRMASTGNMPAFSGTLSEEQIHAVVLYEREGL